MILRFSVEVDETTDQGRQLAERLAAGDQVRVFFNVFAPSDTVQFTPDEARQLLQLLQDRGLSERQAQIILLDAQGYSRAALAEQLTIAENTIKWHWRRIYEVLDVTNRDEVRALLQSLR